MPVRAEARSPAVKEPKASPKPKAGGQVVQVGRGAAGGGPRMIPPGQPASTATRGARDSSPRMLRGLCDGRFGLHRRCFYKVISQALDVRWLSVLFREGASPSDEALAVFVTIRGNILHIRTHKNENPLEHATGNSSENPLEKRRSSGTCH